MCAFHFIQRTPLRTVQPKRCLASALGEPPLVMAFGIREAALSRDVMRQRAARAARRHPRAAKRVASPEKKRRSSSNRRPSRARTEESDAEWRR